MPSTTCSVPQQCYFSQGWLTQAQAWTQIFKDGSATDAVTKGGAGELIILPNGNEKMSGSTGVNHSIFKAEPEAFLIAANEVKELIVDDSQIVFLTDSMSN